MSRNENPVYLNGAFIPRSQAKLDIEDRGALFADGVYEVVRYYGGRSFAMRAHTDRLRRSLAAIRLAEPPVVHGLGGVSDRLVRDNGLTDAKVYWQVTRGSATRDHVFPENTEPTVLAIAYPADPLDHHAPPKRTTAILTEDSRWHHCSIKSLMLLPNVLAKNLARDAGADEAILHRRGVVTEGTATSVFAVIDGQLRTHRADQWILGGITRGLVIDMATDVGIDVCENAVRVNDLFAADEVILCGTTVPIASVCDIDGREIGTGTVGPVAVRLHRAILAHIAEHCGLLTSPDRQRGVS